MRGVSASGKSTVSQQLLEGMNIIRIRSDVERKRLFDITPTEHAGNDIDTGIYSHQASQQTYQRLLEIASVVIEAGYSVIVDAAFLAYQQRAPFQQLAGNLKVPFILLELTAPAEILRQRIANRKRGVSDADLAVLEHQLANLEPLQESEFACTISVDTTNMPEIDSLIGKIDSACSAQVKLDQ